MTAALQYALIYAAGPIALATITASVWEQRARIAEILEMFA